MSDFEFFFSFYGLLLGLSVAELVGGFSRVLHERHRVRFGWLTPLLALFVLLDLLSFWAAAWAVRDVIAVSGTSLMSVMLFASAYYLAAHLVFPDPLPNDGNLDPHYYRVRRTVIVILVLLLFVQLGYYATQPEMAPRLLNPLALGLTAVLIALMGAAWLVRSKPIAIVVLLALIARYAVVYVL
jgi:hypothetical protein